MKKYILLLCLVFNIGGLKINAQAWKNYGNGLEYPVNSISYYNNKLYAAGGGVFSWNGESWEENSNGMILIMDVYSLAVYNGNLFSGGYFTVLTPENNWYNNTARYNEGTWTTCGGGMGNDGSGMDDYVNTLIVYNGELYAGGRFGSAGGDPLFQQETPYIARFDGSFWNPVGEGMDYTVTDFTIYNNELAASGFFTSAGGIEANYITKWNGTTWSSFGSGMDGKVTALAVYNNELYAGGLFSKAGDADAHSIAKWNGESWSQVGSGISGGGQVYTLAVYNNELYAGGTFVSGAGNAGDYIMKWNGSEWQNVGSGTDGPVIYIYPYGAELIIGGDFSTAGGVEAKNIAYYSNTTEVTNGRNIPDEFILKQNYPNPFNPITVLSYRLPIMSKVSLKVYDVIGKEIVTLVDEYKPAGAYEVEFDATSLTSGMYIYKISAGEYKSSKKMLLVK